MIDECFVHCRGIGPKTNNYLKETGFINWKDCISKQVALPFNERKKESFLREVKESTDALENEDINFFISRMPPSEHWRILGYFFERATFFDIETTGLSWHYSHASVIVAYHGGEFSTFLFGENMDDFLSLIDESEMLVSFNGNCFDIPFIEKTFNIPEVECPHLDLRWVAYHHGYRGGLKMIEKDMKIKRPEEIAEIDGFEAVELFHRWQCGDEDAKVKLISYCKEDVYSTYLLAQRILTEKGVYPQNGLP